MKNAARIFLTSVLALGVSLVGGLAFAQEATTVAKTYITNWDIANNAAIAYSKLNLRAMITSKDIKNATIRRADIKKGAITTSRLHDDAVNSDKIKDGAVKQEDLASNAVDAENIADGAVTTEKLADNAVTSAKIAADTIVAADIATGGVATTEILDETITNNDISVTAAIDGEKINPDFGDQDVITTGDGFFGSVTVDNTTWNNDALVSTGDFTIDTTTNNGNMFMLPGSGQIGMGTNNLSSWGAVLTVNQDDYSDDIVSFQNPDGEQAYISNDGYGAFYGGGYFGDSVSVDNSLSVYGMTGMNNQPTFQIISPNPYSTDYYPVFAVYPRGRASFNNYSSGSTAFSINQASGSGALMTFSNYSYDMDGNTTGGSQVMDISYNGDISTNGYASINDGAWISNDDSDTALTVNQNYNGNAYEIASFNGLYGQTLSSRYSGTTITGYDDGGSAAFTVNQGYVNGSAGNVADFNSAYSNVASIGYYGNTTLNSYDMGGSALTVNQNFNGYSNNIATFNNNTYGEVAHIDYDGGIWTNSNINLNGYLTDGSDNNVQIGDGGDDVITIAGTINSNLVPTDVSADSVSDYDLGADAAGSRWSTIYADTLNYAQALTDDNSENTTVTMGNDNVSDTVTITANTSISDLDWEVLSNGAASFASVAVGGGWGDTGTSLNNNGDIYTNGSIFVARDTDLAVRLSEYQDAANGPIIELRKGRGTEGAPTAVQTDNVLGQITAYGHDGVDITNPGASIQVVANEDWTASAHGTDIAFWTVADGSTTQLQALRIEDDGDVNVRIGNLLVGIGTTPDVAMDGEDVYIEGTLEVDGNVDFDGHLIVRNDITLGDNGNPVGINSNTWDINVAGAASGFTGFTSTGTVNLSGATVTLPSVTLGSACAVSGAVGVNPAGNAGERIMVCNGANWIAN